MSPAATLAAQLSALAARAAEHSSPIALSAVIAEGFGAIAATLREAESAVGAAVASVVSLSEQERSAFVRDFLAGVGAGAGFDLVDTAAPQDVVFTGELADGLAVVNRVSADQVIDAGPRGLELATALHGLSAEEFEAAVTNARAILFGQVAG